MILTSLWFVFSNEASAVSYEFIAIENLFTNLTQVTPVQSHAIVITSSKQRFKNLPQNTLNILSEYPVYQTQVELDGTVFYRLVLGNFSTESDARVTLKKLKPFFSSAWIYRRTDAEQQGLETYLDRATRAQSTKPRKAIPESIDSLQSKARKAFLDENFAAVISITDRIISTGTLAQSRPALELAGTARERQGKFVQAEILYEALLDTSPSAEIRDRIMSRLEGIRTMSIEPRERLATRATRSEQGNWIMRGALQQYYLNDVIDRPGENSEEVNQALVTDVNLQIQRRTNADTWVIQIDAGVENDFTNDQTDTRISRANLSYAKDNFRIIGGRQYRTVTGVYGRFDGFTYRDLSHSEYQTSYFMGTAVRSTYDNLETERPLVGANLDFSPYDWLDVNLYVINQEASGLTDRQAIGTEFQLRNNDGFVYGIIDYDVFYDDLNNITFISNYRYNQQWIFDLTLGRLNSPLLSTTNALQGQAAESVDELDDRFSSDEIYTFAEDRTGKSDSFYFAANYIIDNKRQLNADFFILDLDATKSSGGVDAISTTKDTQFSINYSVSGFFSSKDYTSIGLRISELDTSDIESIRLRSRFPGYGGFIYDSRIRLDHRRSTRTGIDQDILAPSIKVSYRATKKLDLEANLGIEYSDLDLPNFDRQVAYSLYVGYSYFF